VNLLLQIQKEVFTSFKINSPMEQLNTIRILGINFFNGTVLQVTSQVKKGGLLVVPAAPALITIKKDIPYYQSLLSADIVIPDSGYMSLIWNLFHKQKIKRISGLKFLTGFLDDEEIKSHNIMLVNPNEKEAEVNTDYLKAIRFSASQITSYVAPVYEKKKVEDEELLKMIEIEKPQFILINIGGGIQEKLGSYLKEHVSYHPAIICTGAAIAFLTGQQAKIPGWVDKFFIGWLVRCLENPRRYVPRYFKAFSLISLILYYDKNAPA
jgi:N-acetylglucosaminyldiphosphoundecaprenol N-acetyl-beta-D-mannosaminyltransferase